MYAAKDLGAVEQWIEPPEPALNRYMVRTRRRAANDNRRSLSGGFRAALSGVLSRVVTLVR